MNVNISLQLGTTEGIVTDLIKEEILKKLIYMYISLKMIK